MNNLKIISIFLGIAAAIVIFTFNKAGIMEGENLIMAALKEQQVKDSLFKVEKQELLKNIETNLVQIEKEVNRLMLQKDHGQKSENEIEAKIQVLHTKKIFLLDRKGKILNAYFDNWNGIKQETDSLLQQSPETKAGLIQNS